MPDPRGVRLDAEVVIIETWRMTEGKSAIERVVAMTLTENALRMRGTLSTTILPGLDHAGLRKYHTEPEPTAKVVLLHTKITSMLADTALLHVDTSKRRIKGTIRDTMKGTPHQLRYRH